jgi:hypothetical protein
MVTMWHYFLRRWLNQDSNNNPWSRRQVTARRPSLVPSLLTLEDRTLPSTLTVLNNADSGDGSLRAAIIVAQNGDQIIFDQSLQGQTITLTSGELAITKDLAVEGLGADQLAVSGNHASRVFDISGGVTVTMTGLTITDGLVAPGTADALGGGVFNNGGNVTLGGVTLQNNVARGGAGTQSHGAGYQARGGGLYSSGGSVTIADSTIDGNQAIGGPNARVGQAPNGGDGTGGGLYVTGGSLTVADSTIADNQAIGGLAVNYSEGNGGTGVGGGIYTTGATLTITNSAIASNRGSGGRGAKGCEVIMACNTAPGNGGTSQGGGLYLSGGMLTLTDSTIATNTLRGGDGGSESGSGGDRPSGGVSQGGGLYLNGGMVTVTDSTIAANNLQGASGGEDGDSGASQGGGLFLSVGTLVLTDSTIAANNLQGGSGYLAAGGPAQGAGLWVGAGASAQVTFSTIATNQAIGGSGYYGHDGMATGGGVYNQGLLQTHDTLLAGNRVNGPGPNSGPDLAGDLGSLGHNLIGNSQGGIGYDATDLLDIDPLLRPLADNGGPTQTMALLPGSPALNAGDPCQLGVPDQRGVVRSGGVNIGAYQASATAFILDAPATVTAGMPFDVTVTAVDPFGQVAVGYTGTVTFNSSDGDPAVVLPADYTFTAADAGTVVFPSGVTLITEGDQAITATDTVDGTITGTATVTVTSGNAARLMWTMASGPATPDTVPAQPWNRQAAHESFEGQPARLEAASAPVPLATARHAQDVVFEGWDSVRDELVLNWT